VSSGNGADSASAWDLQFAFSGANGILTPGDTVWLLGGNYDTPNGYTVSVGGSGATQPVVFKQLSGRIAILRRTNAGFDVGGEALHVTSAAQWTQFWDFEITTTNTARSTAVVTSKLPDVVWNAASNTKFINLVIHDGGVAFLNEGADNNTPAPVNVLVSGCIIYNHGWDAPDRGHGHGLYLKGNTSPDVVAADNVIFNGFGYGIQIYSDHPSSLTNNIEAKGNVLFNNGILASPSHGTSANLGNLGQFPGNSLLFERNMLYFSPTIGAGRNLVYREIGLTGDDVDPVGSNNVRRLNYIVGGTPPFEGGSSADGWTFAQGEDDFTAAAPSGTTYFVRTTAGDPNRANVVVYSDQGGNPNLTVDLSGFLNIDDQYERRNAQNFGYLLERTTYSGPIIFQLGGVNPPTPNGTPGRAPVVTGPAFNVFVVTKIPSWSGVNLSGPTSLHQSETGVYHASVTGGLSPFSYQFRRKDCTASCQPWGPWFNLGSSSNWNQSVNCDFTSFWVQVRVTDVWGRYSNMPQRSTQALCP
jgi:hypothetical protein